MPYGFNRYGLLIIKTKSFVLTHEYKRCIYDFPHISAFTVRTTLGRLQGISS